MQPSPSFKVFNFLAKNYIFPAAFARSKTF